MHVLDCYSAMYCVMVERVICYVIAYIIYKWFHYVFIIMC